MGCLPPLHFTNANLLQSRAPSTIQRRVYLVAQTHTHIFRCPIVQFNNIILPISCHHTFRVEKEGNLSSPSAVPDNKAGVRLDCPTYKGNLLPFDSSPKYQVRIEYAFNGTQSRHPRIFVEDSLLRPDAPHIYSPCHICLYHPPNGTWAAHSAIGFSVEGAGFEFPLIAEVPISRIIKNTPFPFFSRPRPHAISTGCTPSQIQVLILWNIGT